MQIHTLLVAVCLVSLLATQVWANGGAGLQAAVITRKEMVVSANPLATEAGAKILRLGGSAADAMVAVQTVLGLVEPQASGLGGGAFILYFDAKTGRISTFDGRERAPAAARENRFLINDAEMGFATAWQSGLSVGVPGVPRLMESLHQRYGRLPWRRLFDQAISLAQQGFRLTERTSSQVAELLAKNNSCADGARLFFRNPAAFDYFVNPADCTAKPTGTRMYNQAYAETLKALAEQGAAAIYTGPIATAIASAVQGDLHLPGDLTTTDLTNYRVVEREPVCAPYKGYKVCGMGPPSSGGIAVGQMLRLLEYRSDLLGPTPLHGDSVHLFTQAGRLAFADRNQYVADSDFVTVPVAGLLDESYLQKRGALITDQDMGTAQPGIPPGHFDPSAADDTAKLSGTSHIAIIDRYSNALSMTTTVESAFGNGVMVHGFLLNNQLTDFSFAAKDPAGIPIANRVQANKRPRSSMAPTIVFDPKGKVALVTGSPGGSRIIGYTAQSIMNVLEFGCDPQQAINLPHYMNRNGRTELETPIPGITLDYDAEALAAELVQRGHSDPTLPVEQRSVGIIPLASGLSMIQVVDSGEKGRRLVGGADMRRDGAVGGR